MGSLYSCAKEPDSASKTLKERLQYMQREENAIISNRIRTRDNLNLKFDGEVPQWNTEGVTLKERTHNVKELTLNMSKQCETYRISTLEWGERENMIRLCHYILREIEENKIQSSRKVYVLVQNIINEMEKTMKNLQVDPALSDELTCSPREQSIFFLRVDFIRNVVENMGSGNLIATKKFSAYINNEHTAAKTNLRRQMKKSVRILIPPTVLAGKKTLVLDLDKTLWIRTFRAIEYPDVILTLNYTSEKELDQKVYCKFRPGAKYLLRNMSAYYELIIFTASNRNVTVPLLQVLDMNQYVSHTLFNDSCSTNEYGYIVKDLTVLGRSLQNVVMVDDSTLIASKYPSNCILCSPYCGSSDDSVLFVLSVQLEKLSTAKDVRLVLSKSNQKDSS